MSIAAVPDGCLRVRFPTGRRRRVRHRARRRERHRAGRVRGDAVARNAARRSLRGQKARGSLSQRQIGAGALRGGDQDGGRAVLQVEARAVAPSARPMPAPKPRSARAARRHRAEQCRGEVLRLARPWVVRGSKGRVARVAAFAAPKIAAPAGSPTQDAAPSMRPQPRRQRAQRMLLEPRSRSHSTEQVIAHRVHHHRRKPAFSSDFLVSAGPRARPRRSPIGRAKAGITLICQGLGPPTGHAGTALSGTSYPAMYWRLLCTAIFLLQCTKTRAI